MTMTVMLPSGSGLPILCLLADKFVARVGALSVPEVIE